MPEGEPLVLLSFDAEEFDLPEESGQVLPMGEQMAVARDGMQRTLDLLDRAAQQLGRPLPTTFFCTVVFARECPDLLRRAVRSGHEIASHGVSHNAFRDEDLEASRLELEAISASPIVGFRRARLAETDRAAIERAGYLYNSSENPIWLPGRYNRFFKPRRPYFTGNLLNIPASATPIVRFPMFWLSFKAAPMWCTQLAARWVLAADPALVLYFHPWELCDLSGYAVPRSVRWCDGQAMIDRLSRYVQWLGTRAAFGTYTQLDQRLRARLTAIPPFPPTAGARP